MNQQQKFKKQKAKERAKYKEKVQQRLDKAKQDKKERLANRIERAETKGRTIRKNADKAALLKNLEILKALEAEYLAAQKNREDLNATLEAEGYHTLEEKIEALKAQSQAMVASLKDELELAENFEENSAVD